MPGARWPPNVRVARSRAQRPRPGNPPRGRGSVEQHRGVEVAGRVEGGLDAAHQGHLDRVLQLQEVRRLEPAQTVLAGDRAAERHRRGEDVAQQPVPLRCRMLNALIDVSPYQ